MDMAKRILGATMGAEGDADADADAEAGAGAGSAVVGEDPARGEHAVS